MKKTPEKKTKTDDLTLSLVAVSLFTIAGISLFVFYKNMPIVRNSLVYAKIIYNLSDLGEAFQAGPHGYNKPLGFAYLALPFFKLFGANVSLKIVSLISTLAWGVSCFFVYKRFSVYWQLPITYRPIFLLLLFLNPLVLYQSISGYPDMLYALAFLWSIFFLDRLLSRDINWADPFLFTFLLLFSIWIKHNGLIIFPVMIVFLICRRKIVFSQIHSANRHKLFLALGCVLFTVGLLVYENTYQSNIFNFVHNKSNFLKGGSRWLITITNIKFMIIYLLICFNCFVFLIRVKNLKDHPEWCTSLIVCVLALLYFYGTRYNLRYYIPLAPFFVFFMLSGWNSIKPKFRSVLLIVLLIVNIPLTIVYNCIPVHTYASRFVKIPVSDNLRLVGRQLEAKMDIDLINQIFREHSQIKYLVYLRAYYHDAAHNIWTREKFLSPDVKVIYKSKWNRYWLQQALKDGPFLLYMPKGHISDRLLTTLDFERLSYSLYLVSWKDT